MSERIRVLHVVDRLDDSAGGGERAALALALSLPPDRFDVWVCITRMGGGEPVAALRAAGIGVVLLERHGLGVAGLRGLVTLIRRLRPDVLHAHMFGSNVWGAVFGRLCRVPVVVAHEQTWSYDGQPLRRLLDGQLIGRLADVFVAVSSLDGQRMREIEKVPAAKVRVIPNAWFARPQDETGDLRAELGLGPDVPLAATVAVMRPQKRLDVLIEAFARVRETVPTAHLVLVGDGGERAAVEEWIARLGLEGVVHAPGKRNDVDAVWRGADVMVLSSDFEGTPLAVLEAMAAGVPIVSTDVGGMPDITDGRCAILVARRDPVALGDALARVLTDGPLRAGMGQAARELAAEFTAGRHAERCAELYADFLARSSRPRRPS